MQPANRRVLGSIRISHRSSVQLAEQWLRLRLAPLQPSESHEHNVMLPSPGYMSVTSTSPHILIQIP